MLKTAVVAVAALACLAGPAMAGEYDEPLKKLAQQRLKAIAADATLVAAIKAQNAQNAGLSEPDIIALDKKWRAEVGQSTQPTIQKVMGAPASATLVKARNDGEGLFTEIFAMDNKGLNVAASDVTSDYWQGDEAKWKKSYALGAGALHLSDVELDESTQTYQVQVSMTVVDPGSNTPVGAITFGVNVEYFE